MPDVLVVFVSDTLDGNFTEMSQGLRDQGIIIITIGVGNRFNRDQLKAIASKPETDHVFTVMFQHVDTMEGTIGGAISQGNLSPLLV